MTKVSLALLSQHVDLQVLGIAKSWERIRSAIANDSALLVGQCMCAENAIGNQ